MAKKWEVKKERLYRPSPTKPEMVTVPEMQYASVSGTGDPNTSEDFAACVEALYGVSYRIKMLPKAGMTPPGYYEYTVPPLEGFWDLIAGQKYDQSNKDNLAWTLVIRQPDFVDEAVFSDARDFVASKKTNSDNSRIGDLRLIDVTEGLCCQMLHVGPFDTEPASFRAMENFVGSEGHRRTEESHHEIYLSDFRRTDPQKLRTILRFRVEAVG